MERWKGVENEAPQETKGQKQKSEFPITSNPAGRQGDPGG